MDRSLKSLVSASLTLAGLSALALGLACGGGGSSPSAATPAATGSVPLSLSDASAEDWAVIGVKVLGITLIPAGGGTAVPFYTAPTPAPTINLVQLDQLSEVIGNIKVPVGTYSKAVLTLSANPGDVYLTAAADPSAGFAGTAGTTYGQTSPGQVQIQGATGATGSQTVQVTVNLAQDLTVTTSGSNGLDLEFDLSHPAFIVDHTPPAANGALVWAVTFDKNTVRHHPCRLTDLVVRHLYGTVTAVAPDNSSMTISKDFPTWPIASPETETTSGLSLPVQADATNGTLFYNLDATSNPYTPATVHDFSALAALLTANNAASQTTYVRLVTRYQSNGTLVAARVYTSTHFNTVFVNPEGHVLHVSGSGATPYIVVENEYGQGTQVNVTAATNFYFHTPLSATSGITPIDPTGGVAFMNAGQLVRGFKVHTTVDPTTMDAVDVDIEIAKYQGVISNASGTSFDYTSVFPTSSDNYTDFTLPYLSSGSANGIDPSTGDAYTGFKWWDVGYPTLINPGSSTTVTAIQSFVNAVGGSLTFGGTPAINAVPYGVSYSRWADPANLTGWSALFSILEPTPLPVGTVAAGSGWTMTGTTASFGMSVPNGTQSATVQLNTAAESAPLVYQVDRTSGVVTISQVDVTTAAGQQTAATYLIPGTRVKVFGVPQSANGNNYLMSYVVFYYTGTAPQLAN